MERAGKWQKLGRRKLGKGHVDRNGGCASPQLVARFTPDAMEYIISEASRRETTCAQVIRYAVDAARQQAAKVVL